MWKPPQVGIALAVGLGIGLGAGYALWHVPATGAARSGQPSSNQEPGAGLSQQRTRAQEKLRTGKNWEPFTGTPKELIARAMSLSGGWNTGYFIYRALEDVPPEQLQKFAEEFSKDDLAFGDGSIAPYGLQEVMRLWAAHDPAAAVAWASALPPQKRADGVKIALTALTATNPDEALRLAKKFGTPLEQSQIIGSIALQLADADPAGAFELLKTMKGPDTDRLRSGIIAKWMQHDPVAGMAAFAQLPPNARTEALPSIFSSWAQKDPLAAMTAAGKLTLESERSWAKNQVLTTWSSSNPAAAAAWFKALSPDEQVKTDLRSIVSGFTNEDPQRALALATGLRGQQRSLAISNIASRWARTDFDAAWTWAQSLTSPGEQKDTMRNLGQALGNSDPSKIVTCAAQIANPAAKLEFLRYCFDGKSTIDSAGLAVVCRSLDLEETQVLLKYGSILPYAARTDPAGVANMLLQAGMPPTDAAWTKVAEAYARQDANTAYTWASSLPQETQDRVLGSIISELARTDAPGALLKAKALTNESQRNETITKIMSGWADHDLAALEQAAPQLSGPERLVAMRALLEQKIFDNPQAAANYFSELQHASNPEDIKAANQSAANLGGQWASTDPKAAAAFVPQMADGEAKDNYVGAVAGSWLESNALAASAWIKELPAGKGKDLAVNNLIKSIRESDPDAAVIWAAEVQAPAPREQAYKSALAALLKKDSAAGQRAVEAAPISLELKQQLLKK
jgi:hypothetical protein